MSVLDDCAGLPVRRIGEVAAELGLDQENILLHGRYIAKVPIDELQSRESQKDGALILVTAMTPTPQGEGKTTTSIGLADGLRQLGKKSALCLREPSLGPYFGIKGGGTGAGRAQLVPAESKTRITSRGRSEITVRVVTLPSSRSITTPVSLRSRDPVLPTDYTSPASFISRDLILATLLR